MDYLENARTYIHCSFKFSEYAMVDFLNRRNCHKYAMVDFLLYFGFYDLACTKHFSLLLFQVPDDYLIDSPSCVHFLLKLLNPRVAEGVDKKVPTNGFRLLAVQNAGKRLDSSSTSIMEKVQEILLSCKVLKRRSGDDEVTRRPELSTKWIALLTIEKACLSAVSIQGNF